MPEEDTTRPGGRLLPLGRFWTIPNMLSLLRLVLAFPLAYLVLTHGPLRWVLALALLAIVTDWFDGQVARWSHTVSDWGKVLDPLADKVTAGLVSMALVVRGDLPLWFFVFVVVRDALIVLGGALLAHRTRRVYMSLWSGKVAVTVLALTILAALLEADPPVFRVLLWASVVLLSYSFLRYVVRFVRAWLGQPEPESPVVSGQTVPSST